MAQRMRSKIRNKLLILLLFAFGAYANYYDNNENTQEYNVDAPTRQINTLIPSILFSDTKGPSFVLSQSSASDKIIGKISNISYYTATDCSGSALGTHTDITTNSFPFIDNQAIYFGRTALRSLSNSAAGTKCILLTVAQSAGSASATIQIRGLTCIGSNCLSGTACLVSVTDWTSSTSTCT